MPLADTRNAMGVLTRHLADQIAARTDANTVDIGRPEQAALHGDAGPKLNLFLYAFEHDAFLRNTALDYGQEAPIWLCLKFLMTAIDFERNSDSANALDLLGQGMLALRDIDMQRPEQDALADNPEPIKITFDNSKVELLSSVMQGTDELYRLSAAFEVRPILLTSVAGTGGAPLIRSVGDPGDPGVLVLPSLGPRLDAVEPESFALGDTVTLTGGDLAADAVEVCFGDTCLPAAPADVANDQVSITVPAPPAADLAAGSHAMTVVKILSNGRRFASNAALGRLRPTVVTAAHGALALQGSNLSGDLTLTGIRLGGTDDAIFVGFYRDGALHHLFEAAGTVAQTTLILSILPAQAIPSGTYRILLRVNGEQATNAPLVDWVLP
jgi:hypothetical protein